MTTPQKLALLGATGSIGRSALEVVRQHPECWRIHSIAGGSRVEPIVELAREFRPERVVVADPSAQKALRAGLDAEGLSGIEAEAGPAAVASLADDPDADAVLQAIAGAAGVEPTFRAAQAGKRLFLANKESVVCGGALLIDAVEKSGAVLVPVDSEHSAIYQCLRGAQECDRAAARLILTASGGPFRGCKDLSGITPEMAVRHPKWSMGRKISVDSASLMNKGLEVIEASWLFGFPTSQIDVVVHPESIIHSMVEYADGAVIAQLGMPDMKTPIAYALGWPNRLDGGAPKMNFAEIAALHFEEPDLETFPLLRAAYDALEAGGDRTIVLNAANEMAVAAFLDKKIGFTDIFDVVRGMLEEMPASDVRSVDDILAVDREARFETIQFISKRLR